MTNLMNTHEILYFFYLVSILQALGIASIQIIGLADRLDEIESLNGEKERRWVKYSFGVVRED